MDERVKELVAIGASAAVNCHPCIDYHLAECRRLGIENEEIKAAIEVGLKVSRNASAKTREMAENKLGESNSTARGTSGCGCDM